MKNLGEFISKTIELEVRRAIETIIAEEAEAARLRIVERSAKATTDIAAIVLRQLHIHAGETELVVRFRMND